ncbi:MAG: addiction module protein, partial [Fimbriiglobus sp.]
QALKLSPADRGRLIGLLLDADAGPTDEPDVVKASWKAELARRVESVRNGTAVTHTIAESTAFVRRALDEARRV